MEHRPSATVFLTGPLRAGTTVGGQFGWGGTPLKKYQGRPKVCSGESEIRRRVQEQKQALQGFAQQESLLRKHGLENASVPFRGALV